MLAWITKAQLLTMHDEQLAEHGGAQGLRDEGLLESALARPKNLLAYADSRPSLHQLAAAYMSGIARNHPFVDGNKRTAMLAGFVFLELNGWFVNATQEDAYLVTLDLAAGRLTEEELAQWFEQNTAPLS